MIWSWLTRMLYLEVVKGDKKNLKQLLHSEPKESWGTAKNLPGKSVKQHIRISRLPIELSELPHFSISLTPLLSLSLWLTTHTHWHTCCVRRLTAVQMYAQMDAWMHALRHQTLVQAQTCTLECQVCVDAVITQAKKKKKKKKFMVLMFWQSSHNEERENPSLNKPCRRVESTPQRWSFYKPSFLLLFPFFSSPVTHSFPFPFSAPLQILHSDFSYRTAAPDALVFWSPCFLCYIFITSVQRWTSKNLQTPTFLEVHAANIWPDDTGACKKHYRSLQSTPPLCSRCFALIWLIHLAC